MRGWSPYGLDPFLHMDEMLVVRLVDHPHSNEAEIWERCVRESVLIEIRQSKRWRKNTDLVLCRSKGELSCGQFRENTRAAIAKIGASEVISEPFAFETEGNPHTQQPHAVIVPCCCSSLSRLISLISFLHHLSILHPLSSTLLPRHI